MLCVLSIKLLLVRLFYYTFPNFAAKYVGKFKGYFEIFVTEFVCMSPLMTVSAIDSLSHSGYFQFKERLNLVSHICLQFTILLSIFVLFVAENKSKRPISAKCNNGND